MIRFIDNASQFEQCRGRSKAELADAFASILEAATEQAETSLISMFQGNHRTPVPSGRQSDSSRSPGAQGLVAGRHPPTGALLTRIYEMNGRLADARGTLSELEAMIEPEDVAGQRELVALRSLLDVRSAHRRADRLMKGPCTTPSVAPGDTRQLIPALLVFAACALATALYWLGLDGPLLFDDYGNLGPVDQWLRGELSTLATMFPNPDSIVFSRPLAMASFMLTASIQQGAFFSSSATCWCILLAP